MKKFFYISKYEKIVIFTFLFIISLNSALSQITILKPSSSDTIFYGKEIEIIWTGNDNKAVDIYYSTDFGKSWEVIATNVFGNRYIWQVPNLMISSITFRITSSIIIKPYIIWEKKQAHNAEIRSVSISSDGKYILSASRDGTVKLWDIPSRQLVDSLMISPSRNVWDAKFYGGKDTIIIAADNRIVVWDRKNSRIFDLFPSRFNDIVRCLAVNYEKRLIAAGTSTNDKKNYVFNWDTLIFQFANPDNWESYSVDISKDGEYLVNATYGGAIFYSHIPTKLNVFSLTGHGISGAELAIWSIKLSPDNKTAISCGVDKTVRLWDLSSQKEIKTFTSHTGHVRTVDISSDGRLALSGSLDDTLRQYFIPTLGEIDAAVSHNGDILSASYSITADSIVTTGRDSSIKLWKNFRMLESVAEVICKTRYKEFIYIPHLYAYIGETIAVPVIFSGKIENPQLLQYSFDAKAKIEVPNRLINIINPQNYSKSSSRKDTILLEFKNINFSMDTLGKFLSETLLGDRKSEDIKILSFEIENDSLFTIETEDGSINLYEYCVGSTQRSIQFQSNNKPLILSNQIAKDVVDLEIAIVEDGNYIIGMFDINGNLVFKEYLKDLKVGSFRRSINTSLLPSGIYNIILVSPSSVFNGKFLLVR